MIRERRIPLETVVNRYKQTLKRVMELEERLENALTDCPLKTGCFLHWGAWCLDYSVGLPVEASAVLDDIHPLHYRGIEEWKVILAEFYAEEATRLVREREPLLKELYALASEIYKRSGRPHYPLTSYYPHSRKPWFK